MLRAVDAYAAGVLRVVVRGRQLALLGAAREAAQLPLHLRVLLVHRSQLDLRPHGGIRSSGAAGAAPSAYKHSYTGNMMNGTHT